MDLRELQTLDLIVRGFSEPSRALACQASPLKDRRGEPQAMRRMIVLWSLASARTGWLA